MTFFNIITFYIFEGICEGYGGSRFVTFDKIDYTYAGNCTHVLAETDGSLGPQFKVTNSHTNIDLMYC